MTSEYEQYTHHGERVWVRKDLKGKHREHCLCHDCDHFRPDDRDNCCSVATLLYMVCKLQGIVTPVWECPSFAPKGGK